MFDFRYHALSLAAVLLALCIGLLLGVAIGDMGLAASAREGLRDNLRAEVEEARDEAQALAEELEARSAYEEQTLPLLVDERLEGRRVAAVLIGDPDPRTFERVREAVEMADGEVTSVSRLRLPLELERLASSASGTRFGALAADPELLAPFGERIGEQLVHGGRFIRDVQRSLFSSTSGSLGGAEAIVIARAADREESEQTERETLFVDAVIEGARSFEVPVVGVELTDTEPSQVDWYQERGIASVDSVDLASGQAALVFALRGAADGAYGVKPTSDALLPEAVTQSP